MKRGAGMKKTVTESPLTIFFLLILATSFVVVPAIANGTETLITTRTNGLAHEAPRIYDDQIVWGDRGLGSSGIGVIYLYNITSGNETEITDNTTYAKHPGIYGNFIAYTDCGVHPSPFSPVCTIYLYDIASAARTRISTGARLLDFPAIYGNRVVWQDKRTGNFQIYINGTSPGLETPVNSTSGNQFFPAIYGDSVVWQDNLKGNNDIYLFNLTSSQVTQVTDNPDDHISPGISKNRIVWQAAGTVGGNYQIFINGTTPGQESNLSAGEEDLNHQYPSISGDWVVWAQTNSTDGNNDIVVNDTGTNRQIPIAPDRAGVDATSISFSPAESLYRIVWDELDTSGYENVYLYTNSSPGACPVAGFTNDFAGGSAPINVNFTDTSSQSLSNPITHWFWDFGDGSNSTLENTSHIYSANGAYVVSLTVSNAYCRNATTVSSSVVIGTPVANFTASPTYDVINNTAIAFNDTSIGNPTQWNWSWGDGTWTNGTIQNPTHSYASPGSYTVSLTVSNAYGSDTITRTNYITVIAAGANAFANATIHGITLQYPHGLQYLVFNYTDIANWTFNPNTSVIDFTPPPDREFYNISIYTTDTGGFKVFPGNTTIAGTISNVHLETQDIVPNGFSVSTGGPFCSLNYSIDLPTYPLNGVLNTQVWEGATTSDAATFSTIAVRNKFSGMNGTAYTIKIIKTNFPAGGQPGCI